MYLAWYRKIKTRHTTQDDDKYLEQSIIVKHRKYTVLLSYLMAFCLLFWSLHEELTFHCMFGIASIFVLKRLTYPKTLNLVLRIESRMISCYQKMTTELQHWKREETGLKQAGRLLSEDPKNWGVLLSVSLRQHCITTTRGGAEPLHHFLLVLFLNLVKSMTRIYKIPGKSG